MLKKDPMINKLIRNSQSFVNLKVGSGFNINSAVSCGDSVGGPNSGIKPNNNTIINVNKNSTGKSVSFYGVNQVQPVQSVQPVQQNQKLISAREQMLRDKDIHLELVKDKEAEFLKQKNIALENLKLREKLNAYNSLQDEILELKCKLELQNEQHKSTISELETEKREKEIMKIKVDSINNFLHDVNDIKAKFKAVQEYYVGKLNEYYIY